MNQTHKQKVDALNKELLKLQEQQESLKSIYRNLQEQQQEINISMSDLIDGIQETKFQLQREKEREGICENENCDCSHLANVTWINPAYYLG